MKIIRNIEEAVEVIINRKILIIFDGESEWGARALGKRSTLYDPSDSNAMKFVNEQKGREWWRPIAGSILIEHAHEYFDMGSLKESPFMSYAVKAKKLAIEKTPSIVHVDGTCRIQTVHPDRNKNYYNLIKCFYEKTSIPLLLNTSFNLAGLPIPEKQDLALEICERKDWDIYFP